jgi:mRNA interferase MazF
MSNKVIRRGDIFIAELVESYPYILKGKRPVIILSNYKACENSPLINILPITSNLKDLPSHVKIGEECGLSQSSIIVTEQICTISKENLIYQIGKCNYSIMNEIKKALDIQLGFSDDFAKEEHIQEAKKMIDEVRELDRCLMLNFSKEIFEERDLSIKCLENYIINHSLNININKILDDGWEANVKTIRIS